MSSPQGSTLNFPFLFSPPPPARASPPTPPPRSFPPLPPRTFPPPPPHVFSPPPPIAPVPTPDNNHGTMVVIVFVSFGGLFCCFVKKARKKKSSQEVEILSVDWHLKVKEAIEKDSHGIEEMAIMIVEDEHVEEKIMKNDKFEKAFGHHGSGKIELGDSSSGSDDHIVLPHGHKA